MAIHGNGWTYLGLCQKEMVLDFIMRGEAMVAAEAQRTGLINAALNKDDLSKM